MNQIMDRKEETKIIKKALKEAGIKSRVSHGKGTAWGWVYVNVGDPTKRDGLEPHPNGWSTRYTQKENDMHERVIQIVQSVTGRHGEYSGKISLCAQ